MSKRYTSSGKRRSSMTHAQRTYECTCGKVVAGNGGKSSHRRACDGTWLSWSEAYQKRVERWEQERR